MKQIILKRFEMIYFLCDIRPDVLETRGFVPLCSRHQQFVASLDHYVPAFGQVVPGMFQPLAISFCEFSQHVGGASNFLLVCCEFVVSV